MATSIPKYRILSRKQQVSKSNILSPCNQGDEARRAGGGVSRRGESSDSPRVNLKVHPYVFGNKKWLYCSPMNGEKQKGVSTLKRRKTSLRLSELDYASPYAYSVTICTAERQELFRDGQTAKEVLSILRQCTADFRYELLAYCLMPDHLHLLASPENSGVSVSEFVRHFKSRTAFRFKSAKNGKLWQRGFYDHVVRKSEDLQTVANYIIHNPVRKGLVETPDKYPYSGPKI